MSSKKDNVINYLENALSILKAKEPKWYEREPFQKTVCWVSDVHKNPKEDGKIIIIKDYDETSSFPFRSENSIVGYTYAVPLTNSEKILKLILED